MRAPMAARRFSVTAALADGARAVPVVWAGAWGVLTYVAGLLALGSVVRPHGATGWVLGAATGLGVLMAWGAANRITVFGKDQARAQGLGPAGLQLGRAEIAMVVGALLNLLFLSMIFAVLALVALALSGSAGLDVEAIRARDWAAVGPPWKLVVLGVVGAVVLAVPVLLVVRLALFSQASVGRGQAVSLNTLGIATGSFWRLLILLIAVGLPLIGLGWVGGQGTAAAVGASAAAAGLWLPFAAGALSAAYRALEYWKPGEG